METSKLKSTTEKAANMMIVVMVVAGTVVFALVNQVSEGSELMSKLFLAFLGAIITVQLIPGLILLGAMVKGVIGIGRKQEVPAESDKHH
jgi:cytochrome b subunit of formate dehydrogenase